MAGATLLALKAKLRIQLQPASLTIRRFETRRQGTDQIAGYIERFCNRQRGQARLNYFSPVAFEQRFYQSRFGET
ncbi:MAG TPA: hypothetical protein DCQ84_16290 [Candidatus Competibacteraceae bacterium]|nr:hypothetical protein [Candidatus Competibacteraceae bacterium]